MPASPLILPKAVLFDMDGTLTQDTMDLDRLRRDLGMPEGVAILEAIARLDAGPRAVAEKTLHDFELNAAMGSELNEGCLDLLDWLTARRIGTALITRNTRRSVATVLEKHGLQFEVQITREDGIFKPNPEPLWLACERIGVVPADTWMVGDWKYDIEAANAAGIFSVWLSHGREKRPFAAVPDLVVCDLCELGKLLAGLVVE
jgi:HAD superfamily hydrolase (TIGR01549 family)